MSNQFSLTEVAKIQKEIESTQHCDLAVHLQSCRNVYEKYIKTYDNNREMLISIFLLYTSNEIKFKQFKKAKSIFEIATGNQVICNSTKLWISYAKFFANRNKQGSTRKTYLKAINTMTNNESIETIWQEFLKFENRSKMVPMSSVS